MTRLARPVAIALGLIAILALTLAAFGLPVGHSLALMIQGAFGDKLALTRTLVKSIPLAITGMGVLIAWRAGMYNIGGEGQFIMGGLAGAILAQASPAASWMAILAASLIGGAIWGGIAGWLRHARNVDVVISTILLNFIAIQILAWAVAGPLRDPAGGVPLTRPLTSGQSLPHFDRQTDLHYGIFIAVLAVLATHAFLYLTKAGFRLRLVGEGERAARANGIAIGRAKVSAMLISGALCGLAGGVEYAGIAGQLGVSFAQGWGFLAIPVALLGGLHPLWVGLSALYFGALFAGSRNLAGFSEQGTTVVFVIQGAAVLGLIAIGAARLRKARLVEAG